MWEKKGKKRNIKKNKKKIWHGKATVLSPRLLEYC
jgi:hypothetical protein